MTRLFFDMEQVAGLARHSREAPARRMTIAQRAEIYGEERCAGASPARSASRLRASGSSRTRAST